MQTRKIALPLMLACLAGSMPARLTAQEEGTHWLDNYAEALRQARQSGKPIFLEFRCEP